ncbi:MAG: MerR family transcriptional regulator [Vicinamibacterales bacterium]
MRRVVRRVGDAVVGVTDEHDGTYPVQAAARLTGLTPDTLRAWERRYKAVTPQRIGRGRAYSRGDIDRLRLLRTAVQHGHAIGTVAQLSNQDVEALLSPKTHAAVPATSPGPGLLDALLDAVRDYDAPRAEGEFGRLAASLHPSALVTEVVIPVLGVIGEQWQRGTLRPGQEHLLSAIIGHALGSLLRVVSGSARAGGILFATPPGERHEFGILSAALLAAAAGVGVVYLGPDLPAEDIAQAAVSARVAVVVIGLTALSRSEARKHLVELRRLLPDDIELWSGGAGSPSVRGVRVVPSLAQFAIDVRNPLPAVRA